MVAVVVPTRRAKAARVKSFFSSHCARVMDSFYARRELASTENSRPALWTPLGQSPKIAGMAKAGKRRKTYRHWYLRDWRKDRGLTLEQLANRVGSTAASISRYEKGEQPYSQPILEALADALSCAPADLIMRPPGSSDRLVAVFNELDPEVQKQAMAVIKALSGKAA